MTVDQLLNNKFYLKIELEELETHLHNKIAYGRMTDDEINAVIAKLLDLREEYQRLQILLDQSNASTMIQIGSKEISVGVAIRMRETTKYRIELLSKLLTKGLVTGLPVLDQKNNLIREYVLLSNKIETSGRETEIG